MSSLVFALFLGLTGCSSTDDPDASAEVDAPSALKAPGKAKVAKKGGKAKAKGGKAKGKGRAPLGKPIGAAGPMTGVLTLTEVETTSAAAAAGAAATEALLKLTFGEGESTDIKLGKVPGSCAETTPVPVGPEGKERTPLWAVACQTGDTTTDLLIFQAGENLAVLRSAPPEQTKGIGYKPVKRVRLAKGAELSRSEG